MSFTNQHLYFDDVEIGQEWESLARTVTQADIVNFAGISGDFNPMHMDHEFARRTPFAQPIAHGMLVWSISSGLGLFAPPMRTMAFLGVREWHFLEPVFINDTIRLRSHVVEKEERARGRRGIITWRRTILNQHDKIVQQGFSTTMVEGRGKGKAPAEDESA